MDDDTARRLQITAESIKNDRMRRQLDAAKIVIAGPDRRAIDHGKEREALGAQAADVAGWRAENAVLKTEVERLRAAIEAFRQDAERYQHAKAHGWPMSGPQCIAWTHDGRMVFGDTPESALDAAMREF